MPPRSRSGAGSATPEHLTAENLETLAAAVAEGKRATVYLREATPSLGIEAGCSAKVVSVEGNTVVISPRGQRRASVRSGGTAHDPQGSGAGQADPASEGRGSRAEARGGPHAQAGSGPRAQARGRSRAEARVGAQACPHTCRGHQHGTPGATGTRAASREEGAGGCECDDPCRRRERLDGDRDARREAPGEGHAGQSRRGRSAMRELGDDVCSRGGPIGHSAAREAAEQRIAALSKELEDARRAARSAGVDLLVGDWVTIGSRLPEH